MPQQPPLPA
uniref:Uncharacterized protein n=1 Tax=Rhizophora mucronata TaxID=61149 RepID=A0A2P2P4Z9_RHIMU